MIVLFDEAEKSFESLGLGVLKDAITCTVSEALNGEFELEMTYPISGSLFSQIKIGRIIQAKYNPYDDSQPFRIYGITKPIKGIVTVYASHVSYDTNGILIKNIKADGLNEVISKIQNGVKNEETDIYEPIVIGNNPFIIKTDISSGRKFETTQPYNLRAILMGDEENSLIGVYKGEIKFNRFEINILSLRGRDRGTEVCYGHNMTDLKHETSNDLLYNKVYPYYHKETTTNENVTEDTFTKAYIVGQAKFEEDWLSYTENGEAYHPVSEEAVQIATQGDYYDKVYCWDNTQKKYIEKIYNQSVTLIQNVSEPTWMSIDWSKFPTVVCRAKVNGYFKSMGETEWSDKKYVGDQVLSINLGLNALTSIASNFIVYFSEVLPGETVTSSEEVTSTTLIELDEKLIEVNTDEAKAMRYDRILQLDLTSEFDEEPTPEKLKQKALEYISENKIGTIKHNTEVSFIDLATTTEKGKYKNFEHVELGDTVKIVYEDLGVNTQLRVVSTDYNVILDRYNSVKLGNKDDNLSSSTIQNGDSIKSLTNDAGYTDVTEVRKLVADTITAEFIQAVNAKLSKAQIQELSVERINCPGIIEASQYVIDDLVAKMLTADNAKIKETLEAGNIKVSGDINIKSGSIDISNDNGISFKVDQDGNVTSNSLYITGGKFDINNGMFEVTNDGEMTAKSGTIGDCKIKDGKLTVPAANIDGELIADKITVRDDYGNLVFSADSETGEVHFNVIGSTGGSIIDMVSGDEGQANGCVIGGFTVTETTIQNGTKDAEGYRMFGKEYVKLSTTVNLKPTTDYAFTRNYALDFEEDNQKYISYISTNTEQDSTKSVMKLVFNKDYDEFKIYIQSCAELNYDYTIASVLNPSSVPTAYDQSDAYITTHDYSESPGTVLDDYVEVTYSNVKSGDFIYVVFRKDSSQSSLPDVGYVLLPQYEDEYYMLILGTKFKVNQNGKIIATDVDLSGKIVATSGEFTGKITANSGSIAGLSITDSEISYEDEKYGYRFRVNHKGDTIDNLDTILTARSILWGYNSNISEIDNSQYSSGSWTHYSYEGTMNDYGIIINRKQSLQTYDYSAHVLSWSKLARLAANQPLYFGTSSYLPSNNNDAYEFSIYFGETSSLSANSQTTISSSVYNLDKVIAVFVTPQTYSGGVGGISNDTTVYVKNTASSAQKLYYAIVGYRTKLARL